MTPRQRAQRALAAARMVPGLSPMQAARRMRVSHETVRAAIRLLETGDTQTIAAVEAGECSIHGAKHRRLDRVFVMVRLPTSVAAQVRSLARRNESSAQEVLRDAVDFYLASATSENGHDVVDVAEAVASDPRR